MPPPKTCRLLHAYPRASSLTCGCTFALIGCALTVALWRDVTKVAVARATADADADATSFALAYRAQIDGMVRAATYIASSVAAAAPRFDISAFREVRRLVRLVQHSLTPLPVPPRAKRPRDGLGDPARPQPREWRALPLAAGGRPIADGDEHVGNSCQRALRAAHLVHRTCKSQAANQPCDPAAERCASPLAAPMPP